MKPNRLIVLALAAIIYGWPCPGSAQDACAFPAAPQPSAEPNIFSPKQEVYLGETIAARELHSLRSTSDPSLTGYLEQIGARLIRQLPPSDLRFQFFVYEAPFPDAFSLPGGRIYVSRKIIVEATDEEELAGVLAHEMGHIITHQGGIEFTQMLQNVLNVSAVSDQADVARKFSLLEARSFRNPKGFKEIQKKAQPDQIAADRVALYLLARAGYDPQTFITFFDRLTETQGETGGWLSDFFHFTKPDQRRLREMIASGKQLPDACIEKRSGGSGDEYKTWQTRVVAFSDWHTQRQQNLSGVLAQIKLDRALSVGPPITHIRFSPDGKYILAQSPDTIYVLSRDPFWYLFEIDDLQDTPNWQDAQFTPDSQSLVFVTANLRVESWDLASQRQTHVREVVVSKGCTQSLLSGDGKTLACLTGEDNRLLLLDVASGMTRFEKKLVWGVPRFWRYGAAFSPDMRYFLLVTRTSGALIDIQRGVEISVSDALLNGISGGFAFLGSDRIAGINSVTLQADLLMFPSGKILSKLPISPFDGPLRAPGHGDYVLFNDRRGSHPSAVMDTAARKIVVQSTQRALDIYDDVFVMQAPDGTVGLYDANPVARRSQITLPGSALDPTTVVVSPDLAWLALSKQEHGAIWEVGTGKQVSDLHEFRSGWFSSDGWFYADFPKIENQVHELVRVSLSGKQSEGSPLQDAYVQQAGRFLVVTKPKRSGLPSIQNDTLMQNEDVANALASLLWAGDPCSPTAQLFDPLGCDVTLEVSEINTGKVLWSRQFQKNAPQFAWRTEESKVLLKWPASTSGARDEIHKYPELEAQFKARGDQTGTQLLEVLNAATGDVVKARLVDADLVPRGVIGDPATKQTFVFSRGTDTVIQFDSQDEEEVVIPGSPLAVSPDRSLLATQPDTGQISVYNLGSLEKVEDLTFADPVLKVQFSQDARKLFVLTDSQTAYLLAVNPLP